MSQLKIMLIVSCFLRLSGLFLFIEVTIQPWLKNAHSAAQWTPTMGVLLNLCIHFFASLTYALHFLNKLLKRNPFILYILFVFHLRRRILKKNTHSKSSSLCNFCSPKLDVRKSEKMAENNVQVTCTVLTSEVDLFDKT